MHKGWIFSDIDGTLTVDRWSLPRRVVDTLTHLHREGWAIAFLSGRTVPHCQHLLGELSFPYFLGAHNGALVLKMPEQKIVLRQHLPHEFLQQTESLFANSPSDWVVYGGWENQNRCFYCPSRWSPALLKYIDGRRSQLSESWQALSRFTDLPISEFVAAKSFGSKADLTPLYESITQQFGLHAPLITDPYNERFCVLQVTGGDGNKGQAGREILHKTGLQGPVIAAGNDLNDIPLLQLGDLGIAMEDGPCELRKLGQIIAPSAKAEGICSALLEATRQLA